MLVTGRDGVQMSLGMPILLWVSPLFKMIFLEGSGGGMNWEIGTDIYTLICIK